MDGNALRERFLCETLKDSIHGDPVPFYTAFEDGEDAMEAFFTQLWETLCSSVGATLSEQPFFPRVLPYILEDTDEGFCAIVTLTLPQTAAASAVSGAVVFGSAMDPRLFAATPVMLKNGETLRVAEIRAAGAPQPIAVLHKGCDNGLTLFDPPTPQKRDPDAPLDPERREAAFVDAIVCWCMEND